jgi:putative spermidine/putrescine transport system permease protein
LATVIARPGLRRGRINTPGRRTGATACLLVAGVYFLLPLIGTAVFSVKSLRGPTLSAYGTILRDPQFRQTLLVSLRLAGETVAASLLLFVPTVYWLTLRFPRARRAIELVTLLPLVVPPIVLIVGLLHTYGGGPQWFVDRAEFLVPGYVVLSFPFMYRALDAGFQAIDVRTLNDAATGLGAGKRMTLWFVMLPNIRMAALSGALLTFALVMGEFTMASLAQFNTFPVYIAYIGATEATPAAALSLLSFGITWLAMLGVLAIGLKGAQARIRPLTPIAPIAPIAT